MKKYFVIMLLIYHSASASPLDILNTVNTQVNQHPYTEALAPEEFTAVDTADCKHFAIEKYNQLLRAGFKSEQLEYGIYENKHIILIANIGSKRYILDVNNPVIELNDRNNHPLGIQVSADTK